MAVNVLRSAPRVDRAHAGGRSLSRGRREAGIEVRGVGPVDRGRAGRGRGALRVRRRGDGRAEPAERARITVTFSAPLAATAPSYAIDRNADGRIDRIGSFRSVGAGFPKSPRC